MNVHNMARGQDRSAVARRNPNDWRMSIDTGRHISYISRRHNVSTFCFASTLDAPDRTDQRRGFSCLPCGVHQASGRCGKRPTCIRKGGSSRAVRRLFLLRFSPAATGEPFPTRHCCSFTMTGHPMLTGLARQVHDDHRRISVIRVPCSPALLLGRTKPASAQQHKPPRHMAAQLRLERPLLARIAPCCRRSPLTTTRGRNHDE